MINARSGDIFGALTRDLDDLHAFIEDLPRGIPSSYPVILVQPPSKRRAAAEILGDTAESLDAIVIACRAAAQKLARSLAALEQRKLECQQALAPVSGLPEEVICRVVALALNWGAARFTSPFPYAQVCSRWRSAARSYRALWESFSISQLCTSTLLDQHVEFARGKPLHIKVVDEVTALPLSASGEDWREKTETLSWESVTNPVLQLPPTDADWSNLRTFEIRKPPICSLCDDDANLEDFFEASTFPQLEDLTISGVDLGWCRGIDAPYLTSLRLAFTYVRPFGLNMVLKELRNLRLLEVGNLTEVEWHPDALDFQLPHLATLILTRLRSEAVSALLQSNRYPLLNRLKFSDDPGRSSDDSGALRQFLEDAPSRLETLELTCSHPLMLIACRSLKPAATMPNTVAVPVSNSLRSLDLSLYPRASTRDSSHFREQEAMVSTLKLELEHRREAGVTPINALTLHTCAGRAGALEVIRSLVGTLDIRKCGGLACDKDLHEPLI